MGKGDKKTKRGKIHMGTFGRRRKRKKSVSTIPSKAKSTTKKDTKKAKEEETE